jgi:hypothetical protein
MDPEPDLEPVEALKAAGVPEDKARVFMESLHRDLDKRYGIPAAQFVTRSDFAEAVGGIRVAIAQLDTKIAQLDAKAMTAIAELKTELKTEIAGVRTTIADARADLTKWFLGSMVAMTAVILTAIRLASH